MIAVFFGPPGVGKGTQAALVCRQRHWVHISTGDMLREAVAAGTQLGIEAKRYMDAGELVPDSVVVGLVEERLRKSSETASGALLDGFPRTAAQAEALDAVLTRAGQSLDAVVYVTAPDEVLVQRLSGRRVCRNCGAVYHIQMMPPKRQGVCDKCGGELYQREDDHEETIRERLRVYAEQTAPLISYYRNRGLLKEVAGERPVPEVQEAINRALNEPVRK